MAAGIRAVLADASPAVQRMALGYCVAHRLTRLLKPEWVAGFLPEEPPQSSLEEAAAALAQMSLEGTVPPGQFALLLGHPNERVRCRAVEALGSPGPEGLPVDAAAAKALGPGGLAGAVAALLRDSSEKVRRAAAEALGRMGPAGAPYARGRWRRF